MSIRVNVTLDKGLQQQLRSFLSSFLLYSTYSPLLWFICAFFVVSDYVLFSGNFLSLYVLTYFNREVQKLGKLTMTICLDIVRGNAFCMPHRFCISRINLCSNFKLIHFNLAYSRLALLPRIVIIIFVFNLFGNLSPQIFEGKKIFLICEKDYLYAIFWDDKRLLIKGYSLTNLYMFNVLTKWIFSKMNCHVCQKMMMEVTIFEDLPMVVSKIKYN